MAENTLVLFPRPNEVVLESAPMPTPGEGELLIATRCSLISTGTELTMLHGEFQPGSNWAKFGYPAKPGYCNIGTVLQVGPGVDAGWVGQRVATYGTHAQYFTYPADAAYQVPEGVPDEHAAFFTISEIVMNGIRRSGVKWGESVAVFGLGLLGQFAVRLCALAGAWPVFAVDISDQRIALLPAQGGIVPINPSWEDVIPTIEAQNHGRKVDVAFELTGNIKLIPQEMPAVRRMGRFILLSSPVGKVEIDFDTLIGYPSISVIGSHNTSHPAQEQLENPWTRRRHNELFFAYLTGGKLDVAPLISHRADYRDAPALYRMLQGDRSQAMGVILDWTKG
ncbi:MAG: zinc-dependent alcohol dehydrogenase [Armatimonadota bacterium]